MAQSHPDSFVHEGGLEPYFPTPNLVPLTTTQIECLKNDKYGKKSLKSSSVPINDCWSNPQASVMKQ